MRYHNDLEEGSWLCDLTTGRRLRVHQSNGEQHTVYIATVNGAPDKRFQMWTARLAQRRYIILEEELDLIPPGMIDRIAESIRTAEKLPCEEDDGIPDFFDSDL